MKLISSLAILILVLTNCQHNIDITKEEQQSQANPNKPPVEAALAGGTADYWLTKCDHRFYA